MESRENRVKSETKQAMLEEKTSSMHFIVLFGYCGRGKFAKYVTCVPCIFCAFSAAVNIKKGIQNVKI